MLQVQTKVESSTGMSAIIKLEEFSTRYRLLRVTAWVLKFVDCLKRKWKCKTSKLMICDIKGAEKAWIRDIQGNLKLEKGFYQVKGVLNVIEVEGILRCEGRLGKLICLMKQRNLVCYQRTVSSQILLHKSVIRE